MLWFFKTMATSVRQGVPDRAAAENRCELAHVAFVKSLILLMFFVCFAAVTHFVVRETTDRVTWTHLIHDVNAGIIGAQTAILLYRVVVLREQCS